MSDSSFTTISLDSPKNRSLIDPQEARFLAKQNQEEENTCKIATAIIFGLIGIVSLGVGSVYMFSINTLKAKIIGALFLGAGTIPIALGPFRILIIEARKYHQPKNNGTKTVKNFADVD